MSPRENIASVIVVARTTHLSVVCYAHSEITLGRCYNLTLDIVDYGLPEWVALDQQGRMQEATHTDGQAI
jgi:hypothetical protein